MPSAPKHPCAKPGCGVLVDAGVRRCAQHSRQRQAEQDSRRGNFRQRWGGLYSAAWDKARKVWRAEDPIRELCAECLQEGQYVPGPVTDHIVPHKGDATLFWDTANWRSLCYRHHAIKTAKEDGGFGN